MQDYLDHEFNLILRYKSDPSKDLEPSKLYENMDTYTETMFDQNF